MKRQIFYWLLGFFLSALGGVLLALWCVDSTTVYTYNERVKRWAHPPGKYSHRKEGWATSHIGALGVTGVRDVRQEARPKVVLWGDSQVEGFCVSDDKKMAQQTTELFQSRFNVDVMGVGWAMSSQNVADYVLQIQAVERILSNIIAHVIVVTNLMDITPNDLSGRPSPFANFFTQPHYYIEPPAWTPPDQRISQFFYRYRLRSLRRVLGNIRHEMISFRFQPGPVRKNFQEKVPVCAGLNLLTPAWEFLIQALKEQTDKPIYFIYAPTVPVLRSGRIDFADPERAEFETFAMVCQRNNIDFVCLASSFVDFFKKERAFPRGFFNSPPGTGHLNKHGHHLVAEAIVSAVIQQRKDHCAFFAN